MRVAHSFGGTKELQERAIGLRSTQREAVLRGQWWFKQTSGHSAAVIIMQLLPCPTGTGRAGTRPQCDSEHNLSVAAQVQCAGFPHPAGDLQSRGLLDGGRERPAEVRGARPFPLACIAEAAVCVQGHGSCHMAAIATATHTHEHNDVVVRRVS